MTRLIPAAILVASIGMGTSSAQAQDTETRGNQYASDGIAVPAAYAEEPRRQLSIEQAARYLDDGALAWSRGRGCVSCHTNGSYLFIRPMLTESLGPPLAEMREFYVEQLNSLAETDPQKLSASGTRAAQAIYIATGLANWDAHVTGELSPETDQALRLVFALQQENGAWYSLDCWPPLESSPFQEATMAAMAVASAPNWLSRLEDEELRKKVDRMHDYLRDTEPPHEYGRLLLLWTSLHVKGLLSDDGQREIWDMILERQNADGGWAIRNFASPEEWGRGNRASKLRAEADFDSPSSDGHMTGLALIVLQEIGMHANEPQIARGLQWLRTNQRESGRWWTRSLNTDSWHFITYSGTAYPLLALHYAEERESGAQKQK